MAENCTAFVMDMSSVMTQQIRKEIIDDFEKAIRMLYENENNSIVAKEELFQLVSDMRKKFLEEEEIGYET